MRIRAGTRLSRLEHPVALGVAAAVGLAGSALVASRDRVPAAELRLAERINDVPDVLGTILYPVMQLGTVAAPFGAAIGLAWLAKDRALAAGTAVAGLVTWFGAKGVKQIFTRGRPLEYLPNIVIREGDGTGLGYISGHAAIAAMTATCVAVVVPSRVRPLLAVVAAVVGVARIVHGVHLPADVVGGWAFGAGIGLATVWVVDLVAPVSGDVTDGR